MIPETSIPELDYMSQAAPSPVADLRLAAIDLDGTLLSADLSISTANRAAIEKLQRAGIEVVLTSGRHYASMKRFIDQLPGMHWMISAQGGEVSSVDRTRVLTQTFLTPQQLVDVTSVQKELGITALFYAREGLLTECAPSEEIDYYMKLSGMMPLRVSFSEVERRSIFKIAWVGSRQTIDAVVSDPRVSGLGVQKVRSLLRSYEFQPTGVSKATGLSALTQHLGLTARNVVAFGDADNDVPMFEWAGLSIAMPHGWESAKARATRIAPAGAPETALARAIDDMLDGAGG